MWSDSRHIVFWAFPPFPHDLSPQSRQTHQYSQPSVSSFPPPWYRRWQQIQGAYWCSSDCSVRWICSVAKTWWCQLGIRTSDRGHSPSEDCRSCASPDGEWATARSHAPHLKAERHTRRWAPPPVCPSCHIRSWLDLWALCWCQPCQSAVQNVLRCQTEYPTDTFPAAPSPCAYPKQGWTSAQDVVPTPFPTVQWQAPWTAPFSPRNSFAA